MATIRQWRTERQLCRAGVSFGRHHVSFVSCDGRHILRQWYAHSAIIALYAERQQILLKASRTEPDGLLEIKPSSTGMHVIAWLPESIDDQAAFRAAFAKDVEVTPLSAYAIKPQKRGALRLGYTGYKPREIWRATRQLAAALQPILLRK